MVERQEEPEAPKKSQGEQVDAGLAALLAESRAGASSAGEGTFRLDWSRALDKIKRFQLTDPHRYVLELVQAGVAADAEQIEITTDADDLVVSFGGAAPSTDELRRLFDYLFSRDPELARNRQLALGINAALALDPKHVILEAGDGSRGARLSVRSHTELELSERSAPEAINGTRIHVRERRGWKVLVDAVRRENAEDRLLAQYCRFAPIPVRLNGRDLRRQLEPDTPLLVRQPVSGKGIRGEVCLPISPLPASKLHLCTHGVEVAVETIDKWEWLGPVGVTGYVDCGELDRNASHTAVRHDNAYRRVMRAYRRAIRDALQALVRQALLEDKQAVPRLREHLQTAAQVLLRARRKTKLPDELERLLDVPDLVTLPFEDKDHGALRPLWQIFREEQKIPLARRRFDIRVDDVPEELRGVPRGPMPLLRAVFHDKLDPVDDALEAVEASLVNRRRREAMRREPKLATGGLLLKVAVSSEEPPVRGEFGLGLSVAVPPGRSSKKRPAGVTVTFLREGVPLGDLLVSDRWLRGRAVLDSSEFAPTPEWDGVAENAASRGVGKVLGLAVLDLLAALYEAYPAPVPPASLVELPRWDAGHDKELPLDGWAPAADWAGDATAVTARLHIEALLLKAPQLSRDRAPWLYDWPLFHTLDGEPRTLGQLEAIEGPVRYVSKLPWGPAGTDGDGDDLRDVLSVTSEQRQLLRRYLPSVRQAKREVLGGRKRLHQSSRVAAAREENLRRAEHHRQAPLLDEWAYLAIIDLPEELGQGQLGIPRQREAASWIRVLVDGLPLCEVKIEGPLPMQAVLASPKLEPDEEFGGVKSGRALERVRKAVVDRCGDLAAELARGDRGSDGHRRRLLWSAIDWLVDGRRRPARRKRRKRRRGKGISKGAALEIQQRTAPVQLPQPILDAPLVRTVSHGMLSLARLVELGADGGRVRWVDFEASEQRSDEPIVIVERISELARLDLFSLTDYRKRLRGELEVLARMRRPRRAAVLEELTLLRQPVRGPQIEGVVGIPVADDALPGGRARIDVLADGRLVETRHLALAPVPLCGVINSPRFVANDAFDQVREDEAWDDALRAVRLAVDRLVVDGCERLEAGPGAAQAWSAPDRRRVQLALQPMVGRRFRGAPGLELAGAPALDWTLARAPLFRVPAGLEEPSPRAPLHYDPRQEPAGGELSLEAIGSAWRDRGRVLIVDDEARGRPAPGRVIVVAGAPCTRAALVDVFGAEHLEDGAAVLARDEQAWQRREQAPVLLPQLSALDVLAPAAMATEIDGVQVEGSVGLSRAAGEAAAAELGDLGVLVRVALDGRALCERELPHPLPGLAVVEARGLAVNDDWTGLADPAQTSALDRAVEEALWRSVEKVARRASSLERWSADDRLRRRLLVAALGALVDRPGAPAVLERLAVAPLFSTVQGQAISAKQLLAHLEQGERKLLVVSDEVDEGDPGDARLILRGDAVDLRVLAVLLGDRLERYDEIWDAELRGRARRRSLERSAPALTWEASQVAAKVAFAVGSTSGLIGLIRPGADVAPDPEGDLLSLVHLHIDRRRVATQHLFWHPRVEAWINDDRLQPNPSFDDVADDEALKEALAAAEAQIPELLARAAEGWHDRWVRQPDDRLRLRLCHEVAARRAALLEEAASQPAGASARLLCAPLWQKSTPGLATSREVLDAASAGRLARIAPAAMEPGTVLGEIHRAGLASAEPEDESWLVLVNEGQEQRAAESAWGALPDRTAEVLRLAARTHFLRRPAVAEVTLEAGPWQEPVICRAAPRPNAGWAGELGLVAPGDARPRLSAALFVEGRLVCLVELPAAARALAVVDVSVADADGAGDGPRLEDDHNGFVDDAAYRGLLVALEEAVPAAVADLASRGGEALEAGRPLDSATVRLLLSTMTELEAEAEQDPAEEALWQKLRDLPLLELVGGARCSVGQLREARTGNKGKHGWVSRVAAREARAGDVDLASDELAELLLLDAGEWSCVDDLVQLQTRPMDERLRVLAAAELRRRQAPREPRLNWSDVLVREDGQVAGITYDLALCARFGPSPLALLSQGRVVEQGIPREERWPGLTGVLEGPFATDDAFTRVRLTREQRWVIDRLYEDRLAAATRAIGAVPLDEGELSAEARSLLDYVVHRATRLLGRAASSRATRRELVVGGGGSEALSACLALPLIPLWGGGRATLAQVVADDDAVVVFCGVESPGETDDVDDGVTFTSVSGGPLATLLEMVLDQRALVGVERWRRNAARRAELSVKRQVRRRKQAARDLLGAIKDSLRLVLQEARREKIEPSWLDLTHVNRLRLGKPHDNTWSGPSLIARRGVTLSFNPMSAIWRAALVLALGGDSPRAAAQVVAALVCELRGLSLVGDAEAASLLGVLARVALEPDSDDSE